MFSRILAISALLVILPIAVSAVAAGSAPPAASSTPNPCSVSPGSGTPLPNPLGKDICTIPQLVGKIISFILGLVGSGALVVFVYGGFMMILAAGNSERITKGRDAITWAVLGLIIVFLSYGIVNGIVSVLDSAGSATPPDSDGVSRESVVKAGDYTIKVFGEGTPQAKDNDACNRACGTQPKVFRINELCECP